MSKRITSCLDNSSDPSGRFDRRQGRILGRLSLPIEDEKNVLIFNVKNVMLTFEHF